MTETRARRQGLLLLGEEGETPLDPLAGVEAADAGGDHASDPGRGQLVGRRQDPVAVLVELADDAGPHILAPIVKLLLELVFDDRPLFLDDEDFLEPLGEMAHALALQGPGHADLVDGQADLGRQILVDAEIVERLADIEIGLAGGDDAEAAPGAVDDGAIELVRAGEGEGGVELVLVQPHFLIERRVGPADVEPARRHLEIGWRRNFEPVRIDGDGSGAVDRLGHRLEGDPASGIPAHRPAVEAEIEEFLHSGRIQHRNEGVHEGVFALMREGGGFAGMVVARQQQHATVAGRAGRVAVLQHVAGTIDPRPLAVPHGEDAIVIGVGKEIDLLAAPDGGRGQVLVDAGAEMDVVLLDEFLGPPQRLVETAQGRPPIAADEAGGVQAGGRVPLPLHHRQADKRLGSGQIDPAAFEGVFVVECYCCERHLPEAISGLGVAAQRHSKGFIHSNVMPGERRRNSIRSPGRPSSPRTQQSALSVDADPLFLSLVRK